MRLAEFLLERYDADQLIAEQLAEMFPPAAMEKMNADIEAKRCIVAWASEHIGHADGKAGDPVTRSFDAGAAFAVHNILLALARPYADHPDYDEAWRP